MNFVRRVFFSIYSEYLLLISQKIECLDSAIVLTKQFMKLHFKQIVWVSIAKDNGVRVTK